MGKALKIDDVSFASANLGTVTPIGNVPVSAIAISGPDTVSGGSDAKRYTIEYTPVATDQRGVVWSIDSGSAYASIDGNGVLSVLPGASNSSVTIKAVSMFNQSIVATKNITVTFASADIWEQAAADSDFGQFMTGMSKIYQATNIEKDGTQAGTAVTQPLSSTSQSFVFLVKATFTRPGVTTISALVARVSTNFCIASNSAGVWKVGGNWEPDRNLELTTTTDVKMFFYYDKANSTIYYKNATENIYRTFTGITTGSQLRPEMYIGGSATGTNNIVCTIFQVYMGAVL